MRSSSGKLQFWEWEKTLLVPEHFVPRPHCTGILHSSMLEMSSGMEECKITAWARNILSLVHAGILHSSMPKMSEEGLIFYIYVQLYRVTVI
jgi:hypothetical protein